MLVSPVRLTRLPQPGHVVFLAVLQAIDAAAHGQVHSQVKERHVSHLRGQSSDDGRP